MGVLAAAHAATWLRAGAYRVLGVLRAEATVAARTAVNREGFGPVPPRRDVSIAARNRERPGRHVLTGRSSVREQDEQDRLAAQLDRRLPQSPRHASSAVRARCALACALPELAR